MRMSNDKHINKDYIGVVYEKKNGFLEYTEVPIVQDTIFKSELDAIRDNDNRTRLDLQAKFTERFPEKVHSGEVYDYIYPSEYYDSYINRTHYPKIMTFKDYKNSIAEEEKRQRIALINNGITQYSLEQYKQNNPTEYKRQINLIEEEVKRKVNEYKIALKKQFNYSQFINAFNYTQKLREIRASKETKMYSTDQLGWSSFNYPIDRDLIINIKTNFGYGSAAYFLCNLQYKGIDIIPYTCVIRYYKVLWTDFVRYTRRYRACRDSWEEAFDFVVETVNIAKQDQDRFIKKWIVNEIEEMMVGLKAIVSSPKESLEKYLGIGATTVPISKTIETGLYELVRNCSGNDVSEYKALPIEKNMAFKAEKVTGCLQLLDNLKKLQSITKVADKCIKEIEELNTQIYPEIKEHLDSITIEVQNLNKKLDKVMQELKPIQVTLGVRTDSISALYNRNRSTTKNGKPYTLNDAQDEFDKAHPEYQPYLRRYEVLAEKSFVLKEDIRLRTNFLNILRECADRINKQLNVA